MRVNTPGTLRRQVRGRIHMPAPGDSGGCWSVAHLRRWRSALCLDRPSIDEFVRVAGISLGTATVCRCLMLPVPLRLPMGGIKWGGRVADHPGPAFPSHEYAPHQCPLCKGQVAKGHLSANPSGLFATHQRAAPKQGVQSVSQASQPRCSPSNTQTYLVSATCRHTRVVP